VGAALVAVALAGCGSGDEAISASTAATLHQQVETLRAAVKDGRDAAAAAAVADLRSTIQRLSGSGELDPADGVVLLTQVDRIAARLDARPTPTPAPPPTPVVTTPADGPGPHKAPAKPKGDEPKHRPKGKGPKK
jgi:hypothetical protein